MNGAVCLKDASFACALYVRLVLSATRTCDDDDAMRALHYYYDLLLHLYSTSIFLVA